MENRVLPTEFAPAERSSENEISRQVEIFAKSPLTRLFDYVPEVILVLNRNRQIVYTNKAASTIFNLSDVSSAYGFRPGELLDCEHAHETRGGCGTTIFCSQCGAAKAILNSLRGEEDVQECRITQKESGDALDLRVWAYPVAIQDETFSVFIISDIADEKRRVILERIFLHDITNTVGGIQGFAEVLKNANPDDIEDLRGEIYDLSMRLIDEINAHRELVAAENNELSLHIETLDSMTLLRNVLKTYAKAEVARDRRIVIASDAEQVEFSSDRVLISRVLGNMTKNALEASSPGDTVTLNAEKVGEEIRFSVHNPSYIPSEVQLQIFQRSFTTKGAGRGLGTYSMRLLTERYLKGKVSFTSIEKDGTTFYANYPLASV